MALSAELVLLVVLVVMLAGGVVLLLLLAAVYKMLDKRLSKKADSIEGGTDAFKAIEQVNKARVNDSKELKERLAALEEKVDLLVKPNSKEKEVEMEKVFAKGKK